MKIPSVLVFILPAGFHRNAEKVKHPWDSPMSTSELMSESSHFPQSWEQQRETGREPNWEGEIKSKIRKRGCNELCSQKPMKTLLGPDINILHLSARPCGLLQEARLRDS